MMFPALRDFRRDHRIKTRHMRVYLWAIDEWNFADAETTKLETIAEQTGEDKSVVSRALTALVAWGYLREHERGKYGERYFTLEWKRRVAQLATRGDAATPSLSA